VLQGFVQVTYDPSWVQPSLASNVSKFLHENRHIIPPDANQRFVWKGDEGVAKAMAGTANGDDWTGAVMYVSRFTLFETLFSLTVSHSSGQLRNIAS
jgi:hypothetical protein